MTAAGAGPSSAEAVLRHVLAGPGPRTRAEMAAACGLSRPTTFAAVERLEALGLVSAVGQRSGVPGRTAALYDLAPELGVVAGIDIGGTNLRVAVGDLRGRLVVEGRRRTRAEGGAAVARQAADLLAELVASTGSPAPLLSVGVSVPGVVDQRHHLVRYAWNIGQHDPYDLHSALEDLVPAPVRLDNNVNLAAIGEQWQGAARSWDTFVVISVGTGVGAGIVHQRSLLRGASGAAGEVSFMPLRTPPRVAHAEEDDAGAVALLRAAHRSTDWAGTRPSDVAELFERARAGERAALDLVEDECRRIGELIAGVCALIDPEAVLLAGGLGGNDLLIEGATAVAAGLVPALPPVLRSGLGERASVVGAVAVAVEDGQRAVVDRLLVPAPARAALPPPGGPERVGSAPG